MSQICSIACGLPGCQSRAEQTRVSIGLRVTAIAIGLIAILIGTLIYCGIPGLGHLGYSVAWPVISSGIVLFLLGTTLECVKKEAESDSANDQLIDPMYLDPATGLPPSLDVPAVEIDTRVKNGHGEFVIFSKSGKIVDAEEYAKAYKIVNQFSLPTVLTTHASYDTATEIFNTRADSIEKALHALDSDLSVIFIPRTLYELVFIHACIEEDITAGGICSFLDPKDQKIIQGPEATWLKITEEERQKFVAKFQLEQRERKCWHLCYFDDAGDPMHPKVIEVAYRLNQLIVNKIANPQEFTFSNVTAFLNTEIGFLEDYYRKCTIIQGTDKEIASCTTPGPTTHFGYESTRCSIKPMGIRNKNDADMLRKAVAMECSDLALKNIFLFRGGNFKQDKPYLRGDKQKPYSLSFGTSLFAGVVYDGGATAFPYMRNDDNDAFALVVPIKELKNSPFYVPLSSTICQLFGDGEIFHCRSNIWEGVNQKPSGLQQGEERWEHLKTNIPREQFVNEFKRFYTQNVIFMK